MKKFKALLLTSLTVVLVCFCFLFAGCKATGVYKFKKMEMEFLGETVEYKVGDVMIGTGELTEDYMVVELKDDGTATYAVMGNEALDCTWEEVDGKIVLKSGEYEIAKFEQKGSKLIMEEGKNKLTLKK